MKSRTFENRVESRVREWSRREKLPLEGRIRERKREGEKGGRIFLRICGCMSLT